MGGVFFGKNVRIQSRMKLFFGKRLGFYVFFVKSTKKCIRHTHTHIQIWGRIFKHTLFLKLLSFPKFVQSLMQYLLGTPHMVPFSGTGRRILKTRWADVFFSQNGNLIFLVWFFDCSFLGDFLCEMSFVWWEMPHVWWCAKTQKIHLQKPWDLHWLPPAIRHHPIPWGVELSSGTRVGTFKTFRLDLAQLGPHWWGSIGGQRKTQHGMERYRKPGTKQQELGPTLWK